MIAAATEHSEVVRFISRIPYPQKLMIVVVVPLEQKTGMSTRNADATLCR
jgi:hypothetical protein